MITLKRDNIVMEVATELQASVFLRSGYVRVENAPVEKKPAVEAESAPVVKEDFATEKAQETAPKAEPELWKPVEKKARGRRRVVVKDNE